MRRCSRPGWPLSSWGELRRAGRDGATPEVELTAREIEVLRLVATGMSYRDIADSLVISHRTVQNHVQSTLRKLHLHDRVRRPLRPRTRPRPPR